jgi:two-component system, chemotaxis family, protein-glutamate methylesterase/glutaminase
LIRLLLAEDSATTREYLAALLGDDPAIEVAGTARDGAEAVEQAERLRPGLILMDINMPRLSGLEAARQIMERAPAPIVLISASADQIQVAKTFAALDAGALAVLEKPFGLGHPRQAETTRQLLETVKLMAEVKVVRRWPRRESRLPPGRPDVAPGWRDREIRLVAMGASTGGPPVVAQILKALPRDLGAPVLLVQHIAPGFVAGLAGWLAQVTRLPVKLAEPDERARPGTVYVARDGAQLGITAQGSIVLTGAAGQEGFCPSVSHLFEAAAAGFGRAALGVLLTGMGRDGAAGLRRLRDAGGLTVTQDEATSVVFGMPRAAIQLEAAALVLAPERIAQLIASVAGRGSAG